MQTVLINGVEYVPLVKEEVSCGVKECEKLILKSNVFKSKIKWKQQY